jgi:methionyl aminopeptidase
MAANPPPKPDDGMIVKTEDELQKLKDVGRLCAISIESMAKALEPGITTAELDAIGRKVLEDNGAQSAPEFCYKFPGATCISVNEEVAHYGVFPVRG